ncbi:MAG: ribonuclease H-like domain-containing protein [Myxococcales bacterium]|nr:ribonuclease H-like domain-containing protein [Myxococcales bacterium]
MTEIRRLTGRLQQLKTRPAEPEPDLPHVDLPDSPSPWTPLEPGSLEALRPWRMVETPHGRAHVFREELSLREVFDFGDGLSLYRTRRTAPIRREASAPSLEALLGDPRLHGFSVADALFLDIEATGLSHGAGTHAFLIGCAWFEGEVIVVEQIFMQDPTTEMAVLHHFMAILDSRPFLVSFNGKSYDLSVLESRLVVTRLLGRTEASIKLRPHFDLLHVSRQAYKGLFPDTRLQTLEKSVLGLDPEARVDDVPGSLVPALYFHYLRTGHAPHLDPVLRHNRTDVLSMVALAEHLTGLLLRPEGELPLVWNLARSALRRRLPAHAASLFAGLLERDDVAPSERRALLEELLVASRRAGNLDLLRVAARGLIEVLPADTDAALVRRLFRWAREAKSE